MRIKAFLHLSYFIRELKEAILETNVKDKTEGVIAELIQRFPAISESLKKYSEFLTPYDCCLIRNLFSVSCITCVSILLCLYFPPASSCATLATPVVVVV